MKQKLFSVLFVAMISFCFVLAGCQETPIEYDINVLVNGANFGTVEDVSGSYVDGTTLTIRANPLSGQSFFGWLHDGKIVSLDSEYTFSVNKTTFGTYLALFNCPDLEYVYLDNFTFTNNVPLQDNQKEQTLTEIMFSIGYNQNEFYEVYICSGENLPTNDAQAVVKSTIYPEGIYPFAFDKTKDLFVKVTTKYTTNLEEVVNNYQSETVLKIDKTSIGSAIKNIANATLNKNTDINNSSLVLEETNNIISIEFKGITEFFSVES